MFEKGGKVIYIDCYVISISDYYLLIYKLFILLLGCKISLLGCKRLLLGCKRLLIMSASIIYPFSSLRSKNAPALRLLPLRCASSVDARAHPPWPD
jgi:hypothetical protein